MDKVQQYQALTAQIRALLSGETDEIARMANLAAALHGAMPWWWTGFYRVQGDQLVLGPFQGPVACTRIAKGRGVCGTAWAGRKSIIVPDVDLFPGHIACSQESRSEIVIPVWSGSSIVAVLDIDSRDRGAFDQVDRYFLETIASLLYGTPREICFAAGCFWGAQKLFSLVEGVLSTQTGFTGGSTPSPTYEQVYTDTTGHAECVCVRYDPAVVSLKHLTELYFRAIDPLSINKQGEDEGTRYRTGVYYSEASDLETLRPVFESVRERLGGRELAVELGPLQSFYPASEYHQDYLLKNPGGYCHLGAEIFALARELRKD